MLAVLRVQFQRLRRRRFAERGRAASVALRGLAGCTNGSRAYVEVVRGLPVIITIFFVSRVLPEFGLDFCTLWYLVIGLTIYNGVGDRRDPPVRHGRPARRPARGGRAHRASADAGRSG